MRSAKAVEQGSKLKELWQIGQIRLNDQSFDLTALLRVTVFCLKTMQGFEVLLDGDTSLLVLGTLRHPPRGKRHPEWHPASMLGMPHSDVCHLRSKS